MSKYSNIRQIRPQDKPRPWKIHPVWQGFGCIMIIVVPIMAYAAADLIIEAGFFEQIGVPLSRDFMLTRPINPIPGILPYLQDVTVDHLYANLAIGAILMLLGFGILMVIYTIFYRILGPSQLGPMDAKPIRRTPRKSSTRRRR
jgi:hypothetical protein